MERRVHKIMRTVGIIGIGKMGLPMVRHLLARGFSVAAYDLDPARTEEAATLGARACADPGELAAASDLVIVVVGFDNEVLDVLSAPGAVLERARPGTVIAVASTVRPETMQDIEALARNTGKNLPVLDIPLCRGEPAAEAGKLLLLAGGDEAVFETCRPAFACFANDLHRLGGLGAGQVGKMVNNLLLWACVSANYEGLKLGEALGVDPELLRQALLKSSGNNWALETWLQPRPAPWAEKDMTIVLHEADRTRVSLPLCGVVKEVIKGIKVEGSLAADRRP
jgi:3-hydroxyisobutyrate dehydrogenase-like beta-hydroxyacid dehydrogenase